GFGGQCGGRLRPGGRRLDCGHSGADQEVSARGTHCRSPSCWSILAQPDRDEVTGQALKRTILGVDRNLMETIQSQFERVRFISNKGFEDVVARLYSGIGRPNMAALRQALAAARSPSEYEAIVRGAVGPADLMEFLQLDLEAAISAGASDKPHR